MGSFFDAIRKLGFTRGPERIIGGICGGIADKSGIPVLVVRIGMLLAFLLPFFGIGAYVLGWLLLPWQDGSIALERILHGRNGDIQDA
ncbi:MAG: PspC domain-containing protein [Beutenbergiaceae bacterium]